MLGGLLCTTPFFMARAISGPSGQGCDAQNNARLSALTFVTFFPGIRNVRSVINCREETLFNRKIKCLILYLALMRDGIIYDDFRMTG